MNKFSVKESRLDMIAVSNGMMMNTLEFNPNYEFAGGSCSVQVLCYALSCLTLHYAAGPP